MVGGYVVNFSVYLGSEGENQRIHGLGYDVVMNMVHPFLNRNHHLYFENLFSSLISLDHLLNQQTYPLFYDALHTQRPSATC